MDLLDDLRRRAAYDTWANTVLAAALTDAHERPVRLMAHAVQSVRVWLDRIAGTARPAASPAAYWPAVDAAGCRRLVAREGDALVAFVQGLDPAGLGAEAVYVTSAGREYRTPVRDALTHLLLHGHYHRGQAVAALRALGEDAPWTDFIAWVRLGEPPPTG